VSEQPSITEWDIFPFEGDIRVRELAPPVLPEPPRGGEEGGGPCWTCGAADDGFLWVDDHWRVSAPESAHAVPYVMLHPRTHCDLSDMPSELVAQLGPMTQRIEAAFLATGRFGRVHINRWGDGGAHFHLWFYGRPLGARQLLGAFLPIWNIVLPPADDAEWWTTINQIGDNLAKDGGVRHVTGPAEDVG
jgi:diadenosine tetraphosphate (Ap4A) HIT family hydrolase